MSNIYLKRSGKRGPDGKEIIVELPPPRRSLRIQKVKYFDDEIKEKAQEKQISGKTAELTEGITDSTGSSLPRKRGRPKKIVSLQGQANASEPKRKRGRPRKDATISSFEQFKFKQPLPAKKPTYRLKPVKQTNGSKVNIKKDFGIWKPLDDLSLIIAVQQCNDLKLVFLGTIFSGTFTFEQIKNRWKALLYNKIVSKRARSAIRNLHPEMIASVYQRALFSSQETVLLNIIKSTSKPTLNDFQNLLNENPNIFLRGRTSKTLQKQWTSMKDFHLLYDQTVPPEANNFIDTEMLFNDKILLKEQINADIEKELVTADRKNKQEIRHLEHQLEQLDYVIDPRIKKPVVFDNETLGILRGRTVRYLLTGREITFGRTTKDSTVDIDLSLEGSCEKVSRKQGKIIFDNTGHFYICNMGKRPVFINGNPVLSGSSSIMHNNAVLEIAGLRLIFLINHDLINAIRKHFSKTKIRLV